MKTKAAQRRSKLSGGSLSNPPADVRRPEHRPPVTGAASLQDITDAAEASEEIKIRDILEGQAASGGKIYLQRRKITDADYFRIGHMPVENFTIDLVQEIYGGGDYKGQVMSSTGRLVKGIAFKIDHSIPYKHPSQKHEDKKESSADLVRAVREAMPDAGARDGGMAQIMPLLIQMQQSSDARFEAMLERMNKPQGESKIIELLLTSTLAEKKTSTRELVETMQLMKRLQGGKDGDGEDEEPKTGLDLMMEKIGKLVGPMIEGMIASKMAGGQTQPALTAGNDLAIGSQEQIQTEQTKTETPDMMIRMMMNQFRSAAVQAARGNKDPFQWTQSMLEMVPADKHQAIFQMANAENWFATIFGNDPDATKYLEFMTQVREAVLTTAFATFTMDAVAKKETAPNWVEKITKWISPSFHQALLEMAEDDPFWTDMFGDDYVANAVWLEEVKKLLIEKLGGGEPANGTAAGKK